MNSRVVRLEKLLKLLSRKLQPAVQKVRRIAPFIPAIVLAALMVFIVAYSTHHGLALFQSHGEIAAKERNLMFFALGLSVIVVVPVFILLGVFAWRYRESNHKAKYSPELAGSRTAETIWWLIPTVLISILSVVGWTSSHALDPSKALVSSVQPMRVQVISLDWKWLFIYPDQQVASVNELHLPLNTPINFTLTSDAPMNSLWIPQLGGQIYTMPGMSTQLHLIGDTIGTYRGQSANISGKGFAGMRFNTQVQSSAAFNAWVALAVKSKTQLSQATYDQLSQPSENNKPTAYRVTQPDLYDNVIMKYMMPAGDATQPQGMAEMR